MRPPIAAALLALAALPAAAHAQSVTWCLDADGSEVVPPNGSLATATGIVTLDTAINKLSYWIEHEGLTGIHVGSHFHGPAPVGQTAGIQLVLGVDNPVTGAQFITVAQMLDLQAGLWYVNLHSTAFPGGEVRGQVADICAKTHCTAIANSSDPMGARLVPGGLFAVADNALNFTATGVPPNQFGFLLIGQGTGQVMPPGSSGFLCLIGNQIGRFTQQIMVADGTGAMGPFTPDLQNLPNPPGGSVMSGETWGFQAWFRDGATSNFTDAVSFTFL